MITDVEVHWLQKIVRPCEECTSTIGYSTGVECRNLLLTNLPYTILTYRVIDGEDLKKDASRLSDGKVRASEDKYYETS